MAALVRLVALAAIVLLGFYLLRRFLQATSIPKRSRPRLMPFCPKCESTRYVVVNPGIDSRYPREQQGWYCQHCKEGF